MYVHYKCHAPYDKSTARSNYFCLPHQTDCICLSASRLKVGLGILSSTAHLFSSTCFTLQREFTVNRYSFQDAIINREKHLNFCRIVHIYQVGHICLSNVTFYTIGFLFALKITNKIRVSKIHTYFEMCTIFTK